MASGIGAGLLLSLACLVWPALALAQTDDASRAAARDLGTSGVEAYQRDSFAEASGKLEKAYQVLRVPSLGLWSARALVKVGQLVKASERYREVMRLSVAEGDQAVQKQAQTDAAAELDALTPRIPRIVIKLEGATADDTTVTVDGVAVSSALIGESRVIDPGKHVVVAERAGQTARVEVVVAEAETKDALLRMQPGAPPVAVVTGSPAPPSTPPPASQSADTGLGTRRTLALVVAGVGVVGVGVGSVFGVRAKSKLDEADGAGCSGATCPTQAGLDANDSAVSSGTVSTVAFAIGAAGLVGGAVLWFTGGPGERRTARVGVGPGRIQFQAVW